MPLDPPARRLPIGDASGAVLYVIHDSTLTAYAEWVHQTTETLDKTFGDLFERLVLKKLVEAVGSVGEKATVSEVLTLMGSAKNCNDAFRYDQRQAGRACGRVAYQHVARGRSVRNLCQELPW